MAVGSGLLDELFLNTEVNKAVVCHSVRSLESQLSFPSHNYPWVRHEVAGNYMASSGTRG